MVLAEAERLDVPVRRISQGSGVWMLTDAEITDMVAAATERGVELCLFTGPRGTWDIGGSVRTDSRGAGPRARGHDAVAGCVEDAVRATELGVRCLLVADEGVLWTLHRARLEGLVPADTTLKVSALIGPVNPASYAVYEGLGADSINVPSDLTPDHLTAIRRVSAAPMDLYIEAPDDLGGPVRMYEVAELIRRGAPLYLRFGRPRPGPGPARRSPAEPGAGIGRGEIERAPTRPVRSGGRRRQVTGRRAGGPRSRRAGAGGGRPAAPDPSASLGRSAAAPYWTRRAAAPVLPVPRRASRPCR